ncbi:MAG: NAD-glutamate dehydrogenase, partial [Moraxellaceae bacterium]
SVRSRIHRQSYSDYVVIKRFNSHGEVSGEMRFLGLYTSNVYVMSPTKIPLVRNKVNKVFERSGLSAHSHDGKYLLQILETFPRDELFLSNSSELYEAVTDVAKINERYMVRLLMRHDPFGKFLSCLVYIPRDVFTTQLRLRIQELIGVAINATECEFTTYFSESILARVYLVFKIDATKPLEYDHSKLQKRIREISRSWEDHLQHALIENHGEEKATQLFKQYRVAFPSSYKEHFDSNTAVHDMVSIAKLNSLQDIAMSFYKPENAQPSMIRFKIFRKVNTIELSDVIPVLEHLGLRVISENPYAIRPGSADVVWLHDFQLSYSVDHAHDIHSIKDFFKDAFSAIWHKKTDNDAFNTLVLSAQLQWREVSVLRAYASYMRQTLFNFSEHYIAAALVNHGAITRQLFDLFAKKFDPQAFTTVDNVKAKVDELRHNILKDLDAVENLNEDKI